jgi:curved DNA-binding protein
VKFQDYYATLGVDRGASREEIQRAYRKLARKHHPDIDKSPGATQRFAQINEAHEVLEDPEKRKRYDALGSRWKDGEEFQPPPEWQAYGPRAPRGGAPAGFEQFDFEGPEGFSSFFEAFFGGMGGGMGGGLGGMGGGTDVRTGRPRPRTGRRLEATLEVDLEDAYSGATRTITLASEDGATKSYDVRIPPGTTDGSTIRLRGQGDPGRAGGEAGDLLLHVKLRPHPRFRPEGSDVHSVLRVSPPEAALGAKIDLELLGGARVVLTVPPGSSSGKKLRVRGMGLPLRAGGRGDLIVELSVVVPGTLDPEEKSAYEALARVSRFDPRAN